MKTVSITFFFEEASFDNDSEMWSLLPTSGNLKRLFLFGPLSFDWVSEWGGCETDPPGPSFCVFLKEMVLIRFTPHYP